ncbi:para-aminobenzoate synthetase component 2 [Microbacterium terrae]|uniref:Aminodeoxychorismate synthase component 2 n=1 Tax=Microbacterium terrae TaxID=69369 RepID=A0A0M2GWZ8_9MICO|nr:gamma-glutamyl-gamma-aminobutyrate hydrolase family protein [Microbacterium terrae]KJL38448.1 Aminodeoxychorismate synthase component 2 [Microbacterium terrae]MBP1078909.1 para-aminobenzoate synthetase component 2 [Microbacterium terrae]GLJ98309.1 aminodeoxychorismate/anthranilate synthase component II [Microbacterium terrae]
MTRILVVDNHDSFVFTLIGYLHELGADTDVVEADAIIDVGEAIAGYAGVLVSPGPGTPAAAGASVAVVRSCAERRMPLLGVCLGHQAIAEAFGATVSHAPELMHGMTSPVHHDGRSIYAGLPDPFTATRYHSLAVEPASLPDALEVASSTAGGVIMGLRHRDLPIDGVQFHPESVLTEGGYRLLGNWLSSVGSPGAAPRGALLHPHRAGRGAEGQGPVQ